jgi:putative endonuclease
MEPYTVYIIQNNEGLLYKGVTVNLLQRVRQHNTATGKWTSKKGPWNLVYSEIYTTKTEALKREKFLKSGKGRELLKKLLDK